MLSEASYLTAIAAYCGAALVLLACLGWWLARCWRFSSVVALLLPLAALLLTPAFPQVGVDTLAPALIVGLFQTLTAGFDQAMHAWRPLAALTGGALLLSLLIIILQRRRARPEAG